MPPTSGVRQVTLWLSVLAISTAQADDCLLQLGFNDEPIPPYIERSVPSAGPQGSAFALVDLAAHRIGCRIVWQPLPNLRVLHATRLGDVDGALFYSWTAERARTLIYPQRNEQLDRTRRIATLNYVLYRQHGRAVEWDGVQLRPEGCAVGYNEGWSILESLKQRSMTPHSGKGAGPLLKLLAMGRLCAYATLEEAGDAALSRQPGQFEKLSPPLSRKDYYLPFNAAYYRANPARVEALWTEIGALRDQHLATESK